MSQEIRKNDVGTELRVTLTDSGTAVDVSTATTLQIKLKAPSGTVSTKTASYVTNGTNGQIKYVTQSGDLSETGTWRWQAYVVIGTSSWHSEMQSFKVHENLE